MKAIHRVTEKKFLVVASGSQTAEFAGKYAEVELLLQGVQRQYLVFFL